MADIVRSTISVALSANIPVGAFASVITDIDVILTAASGLQLYVNQNQIALEMISTGAFRDIGDSRFYSDAYLDRYWPLIGLGSNYSPINIAFQQAVQSRLSQDDRYDSVVRIEAIHYGSPLSVILAFAGSMVMFVPTAIRDWSVDHEAKVVAVESAREDLRRKKLENDEYQSESEFLVTIRQQALAQGGPISVDQVASTLTPSFAQSALRLARAGLKIESQPNDAAGE